MQIQFWYWWILLFIAAPFAIKFMEARWLVIAFIVMACIIRIAPNIPGVIQIIMAIAVYLNTRLINRRLDSKKIMFLKEYVGLPFTISPSMHKTNMAQIDRKKISLANAKDFPVGTRIIVADIQDNALLLKKLKP